jgi:hypothetical protein
MKRKLLLSVPLLVLLLWPRASAFAQDALRSVTLTDAAGNAVVVTSRPPAPAQEDLQAEFAAIDANADGGISPREARIDKYLARAFRTLDANRDGRLQFEEVREWLDN